MRFCSDKFRTSLFWKIFARDLIIFLETICIQTGDTSFDFFYNQLPINYLSTTHQLPINYLSTTYQLPTYYLSTTYQLPINYLSTTYQLPIHYLSLTWHLNVFGHSGPFWINLDHSGLVWTSLNNSRHFWTYSGPFCTLVY